MIFTPLRLITTILGLVVIGLPLAAFAFFLLAIVGSPGACDTQGRTVAFSPEAAGSFQGKWDQLNATLDAGQVSTIVVDESEATSRAQLWIEEHDAPISDLLLCFNTGGGSASAKVDIPFFPGDVDVLVRGTLLLTGERPEAQIDDIEMGGLPGFLTDIAERFVNRVIDDQTEDIILTHDYGLAFGEGAATISGQP